MREGAARPRRRDRRRGRRRWTRRGLRRAASRPGTRRVDARASGTTARFLTAAATLADGPDVDRRHRAHARAADRRPGRRAARARRAASRSSGAPAARRCASRAAACRAARARSTRAARASTCRRCCWPRPARRATSSSSSRRAASSRAPYVDLTLEVMRAFGAELEPRARRRCACGARPYAARDYAVEPDARPRSTRSPPRRSRAGACASTGIPPGSRQTDLRLLDVLERMGCRVARAARGRRARRALASGCARVDVDMNEIPDAVLALAVVALFADGPSTIRNVANLRIKESDRLAALESELRKLGAARARRRRLAAHRARPAARRARSPPTTTTAWRWPSPSPACASRASRSRTRPASRRPGPTTSRRSTRL